MVEDHILAANGGEDVVTFFLRLKERRTMAGTKGISLRSGRSMEKMLEPAQGEWAGDLVDIFVLEFEIFEEDFEDLGGHVVIDFEADDIGETALPDAFFDGFEEIAGFELLNGGIGVARDVEGMSFEDLHAGEERLQVMNDELLEPDEAQGFGRGAGCSFGIFFGVGLFCVFAGILDESGEIDELREAVWNFDAGEALDALRVANENGEVEAEIGDVREGATGIEGERGEGGENGL